MTSPNVPVENRKHSETNTNTITVLLLTSVRHGVRNVMLFVLLGTFTLWLWPVFLTFRRNMLPHSSGSKWAGWVSAVLLCRLAVQRIDGPVWPPAYAISIIDFYNYFYVQPLSIRCLVSIPFSFLLQVSNLTDGDSAMDLRDIWCEGYKNVTLSIIYCLNCIWHS